MGLPQAVAAYLPGAVGRLLLLRQPGRPVDGDIPFCHRLQPFHRPVVAVLADLRHLVRVVQTEDVIYSDVNRHHQYKRMTVVPRAAEYGIAVIVFREVGTHFCDCPVFAYLYYRRVLAGIAAEQGVQYVPMYGGIVVLQCDEVVHGMCHILL